MKLRSSFPLFVARRLVADESQGRRVSRPAVLIAMAGIAVGLAVMMVSLSVITGFKREVRQKIVGFSGAMQVSNLYAQAAYEARPVAADSVLLSLLSDCRGVSHVQRYATKPGMVKTADTFAGMMLKGVGQDYDSGFLRRHLQEGEVPQFTDSAVSHRVVLSRALADKLRLHVGDKVDTYYIEGSIRVRRLTVAGIYQTNFSEFDNLFVYTDLGLVRRLNQWQPDQVTGIELHLHPGASLDESTYAVASLLDALPADRYGQSYCVRNVEQLNPQVFAWLDVLDVNIWVILVLMAGVAGFTMISGLLIIIIERTAMIGTLKSLGADNRTIRHIFLWFAVFLIGRGMLWGNAVGIGLCLLQHFTGIFRLDPASYYMDTVPVSFDLTAFLLLNAGTLLVSVLMLVGPSYLVTRIHPSASMHYE